MIQIASPTYQLFGFANSMQGGRPENQDDFGFAETPLGFAMVVCDGMGGGPGGKTASYIAKNEFLSTLMQCNAQTPPATALRMAVSRANDAMEEKMNQVPELRGMGSTLVAVLVSRQSAFIAHLGDSRCYQLRGRRVRYRTDDHSLVGDLVRGKVLTEEQARVSPQSNVITRGLGNTSNHVADVVEVPYRKGDCFVLCTDGVWGSMRHEDLLQRLTSVQDIASKVGNLSAEVDRIGFAAGGHHDNHTLAIIETKTDSILKEKMSKQVKILLAALSCMLLVSIILNILLLVKMSNHAVAVNDSGAGGVPVAESGSLASSEEPIATIETASVTEKAEGKVITITEENDSLGRQIKKLKETQAEQQDKAGQTVKEMLEQVVAQLNGLKAINEKDRKDASKKSEVFTKTVKQLLTTLKEKVPAPNKQKVADIESHVSGEAFDCTKNIWPSKKMFVTSPNTRKVIDEKILPKVEELKKNL